DRRRQGKVSIRARGRFDGRVYAGAASGAARDLQRRSGSFRHVAGGAGEPGGLCGEQVAGAVAARRRDDTNASGARFGGAFAAGAVALPDISQAVLLRRIAVVSAGLEATIFERRYVPGELQLVPGASGCCPRGQGGFAASQESAGRCALVTK